MSNNQFTGAIPVEVFNLPVLIAFGAGGNCLNGPLPPNRVINPIGGGSHSYILTKHITGSIPSCVFNLPALQVLHLSGNSITGSISSDVEISPSLQDLSLSHNQLTGTIPLQIQSHPWSSLDLSFNKLTGVLSDQMQPSSNTTAWMAGLALPDMMKPVRTDYTDTPLKPLFNRDAFVLRTVNCIAILLTFGV
eukprot:gene37228-45934_t